jgi:hypothetical protein
MQGKNIILVIGGKSHTISKETHINYGKIVDALKAKDLATLQELVDPKTALVNFGKGNISIEGSVVYWKGTPFHNALSSRMVEMYQDGFPIEPMINFMENLMSNPSKRSVDQVYGFLEKNSLPITEDGHFLAYKKVSHNYMDIHTSSIDNGIGQTPTMDRNMVDDNPDSLCSSGLHFCSESYLNHFGSSGQPVMILKINPADVVSIPADYNGAKGRCCKYEVVGKVNGDPKDAFSSVVNQDYSPKKPEVTPSTKPVSKASRWPFPKSEISETAPVANTWPTPKAKKSAANTSSVQMYDLVRVNGGDVEYTGMSLTDAKARVYKNANQKKVKLKVVKTGTSIEV